MNCFGKLLVSGVRLASLNCAGRIGTIVEIQRVTGFPPVMTKPVERDRSRCRTENHESRYAAARIPRDPRSREWDQEPAVVPGQAGDPAGYHRKTQPLAFSAFCETTTRKQED